jgi:hypothetical protein
MQALVVERALKSVLVTSKVAVTLGSANVSVLAQLPFVVRVPVSEYVADVARDELETRKFAAITETRAKSVMRSLIANSPSEVI